MIESIEVIFPVVAESATVVFPAPLASEVAVIPSPGSSGLTAYEVAVENGFVGSEAEWLESLAGPPGSSASVTTANVGSALAAAESKSQPVDADSLTILDSAAGNAPKLLSFANLWTWVKSLADLVYARKTDGADSARLYLAGYMSTFRIENFATWVAALGSGGTFSLANYGRSAMGNGTVASSTSRVRSLSSWNKNFSPYGGTPVGMTFIGYFQTIGTNTTWRVQSQLTDSALALNSKGYGVEFRVNGSSIEIRASGHSGTGSPVFSGWTVVAASTLTPVTQFFVWVEIDGTVKVCWRKRSGDAGFGWLAWSGIISVAGGPATPDAGAVNTWNIIGCENAASPAPTQGYFYWYDFISTCGINEPF